YARDSRKSGPSVVIREGSLPSIFKSGTGFSLCSPNQSLSSSETTCYSSNPHHTQITQTEVCATYKKHIFRLSKNRRSGLYASQGSCPLLQFSRFFVGILGAGVRSR